MKTSLVQEIAELYGINFLPSETGERQEGFTEGENAFLVSLGLNPENEQSLLLQLKELRLLHWSSVVDPVWTGREEQPVAIPLRLPSPQGAAMLHWKVIRENRTESSGSVPVQDLPVKQERNIDGKSYTISTMQILPSLPCGYHDLTIVLDAETVPDKQQFFCRIIVAPEKSYLPPELQQNKKIWGLACRLDTIRSKTNWGIGDLSDVKSILSRGAENGAATLMVSPLNPVLLPGKHPEQHRWASRRFLSPVSIDPQAVADFAENPGVQAYVRDMTFRMRLIELRDRDIIDYSRVADLKMTVLEKLWHHFRENHLDPETERGRQFRDFQESGGEELWAWSVYASLSDQFREKNLGSDWRNWPGSLQDPHSREVKDFAGRQADRIAFHQYVQWQAELQLEAVGRRSMELGLKVGLLATLAGSDSPAGFETWRRRELYADRMEISPQGSTGIFPATDAYTCVVPSRLRQMAYEPFIAMLRSNMRYAGGVRIDSLPLHEHQQWRPSGRPQCRPIAIRYPVEEMLAIITLESRRNRCMVILENVENLSGDTRSDLVTKNFYLSCIGQFTGKGKRNWLRPQDYPPQAIVAAGYDERSLDDFWMGKDIERQAAIHTDHQVYNREEKIIARAGDRAQLLVALQRERLLPEGYDVDPATVPVMIPALTRAVHLFLVKSAARIFLLQLENIPLSEKERITDQRAEKGGPRHRKLQDDLETFFADEALSHLLKTFCEIRGIGVVKPSPLLSGRQEEKTATIPRSTYRLQLNEDFSFTSVTTIIPYLDSLGISHCYTSPYLQARPGSPHGYDIIDHSSINTEFGSREDYEEFIAALGRHDMAQLFDMVPNHMGVGSDNQWWMDVLENGRFSVYADFFDINWHPPLEELKDRVLLPVLGDYYGTELEEERLRLEFNAAGGAFYILYYEKRFPVSPATYPSILSHDLPRLEARLGSRHEGVLELHNLINSLENLSRDRETDLDQRRKRHRNKEVLKRLLARLCREEKEIATFIEENVIWFNGTKNQVDSFDRLHELLSRQSYRLAFWRVASDEINYRRFFDINDLAGIRMEEPRVFEETHRLVLDLISTGKIDGLRIDHPDGLFDPGAYFQRLQKAIRGSDENRTGQERPFPFYIVVEKILADFEHLQTDWPVHGTTGYDFGFLVNGLFVDGASQKELTSVYHRFIGESIDADYQIYRCKKSIIKTAMAGELNVLAGELHKLAKQDRHTQDFTFNGLREALIEIIAFLPVYRTYIISDRIEKNERNYIEWAIAEAKKKQQTDNTLIYDFIQSTLLLASPSGDRPPGREDSLQFVMKLQQYTGPVMAKGVEDTFFYIYNRLLSLNEVGGDPRRYGISVAAFHHANGERLKYWPHAMLNTSTHDSKRSEDVRARINVLSELPGEWQSVLKTWSRINRVHKTIVDGRLLPSRNDEYAFYQNLVGIWPLKEADQTEHRLLTERIAGAMLKTVREAKINTSWINRNESYEAAMESFVRGVLADESFTKALLPFLDRIAWFGMLNSLAQLVFKLTSPGVPDIYQGNEIWHFRLVDPDNRMPVDFDRREQMLREMHGFFTERNDGVAEYIKNILADISDGRIKLYTTWKILSYRQRFPDLFEQGSYLSVQTRGGNSDNLCAFVRSRAEKTVLVAAPRLCTRLPDCREGVLPCGPEVWQDTELVLPENSARHFKNIFTDECITAESDAEPTLPVAEVFATYPVALLENIPRGGDDD